MTPPLDLDAIERTIADNALRNIFAAPIIMDLVRELRDAHRERAAVVAWLQSHSAQFMSEDAPLTAYVVRALANDIERGEHRTNYR